MLDCRQGMIEVLDQSHVRKVFYDKSEAKKEFNWYELNQPGFVKDFDGKSLVIPYLKDSMVEQPEVWGSLIRYLEAKHNNARRQSMNAEGVFYETVTKFVSRYTASGLPNDEIYGLAKDYIARTYLFIMSQPDALIEGHFDLHPLNVFLDGGTFVFIDPRAKFSNSTYGPLAYETSKVFYGMMLWASLSQLPINQLCEKPLYDLLLWPIEELLVEMSQLEKAWCIVHLLTAFGALKNSSMRQTIAFYSGLNLVQHIIRFECEWL